MGGKRRRWGVEKGEGGGGGGEGDGRGKRKKRKRRGGCARSTSELYA